MTDTNREIANKELSLAFDGTINNLIVPNPAPDSFSNIPSSEDNKSALNLVNNNFNVNVNVEEKYNPTSKTNAGNQAQQIINNVLNSNSTNINPVQIKKNYNTNYIESGNNFIEANGSNLNLPVSNQYSDVSNFEKASTVKQFEKNSSGNNPNQLIPYVELRDESFKFQQAAFNNSPVTHKLHSYMESDGDYLPGINAQEMTYNAPKMEHYTYSIASIKTDNKSIQRRYDYIKNIIHKSLGEVSSGTVAQAFQSKLDKIKETNYNTFLNEKNINFESGDTNINEIEQSTRNYYQNMERLEYESNKAQMEGKREVSRKITEGKELSNELNNTISNGGPDQSPTIPQREDVDQYIHLNNFSLNDTFMTEINSPPKWRTIYG